MPFTPAIQSFTGPHTAGNNNCAIDWRRENIFICGPAPITGIVYLTSLGFLSGAEQAFEAISSYTVPGGVGAPVGGQPTQVDANGNAYITWTAGDGGGLIEADGSTLAQIAAGGSNSTPPAGFIAEGGTLANIPYSGIQYILATGLGPGTDLNFLATFNEVTWTGLNTTFGSGITTNSHALTCAGKPGTKYGFCVYGPAADTDTQKIFFVKVDCSAGTSASLVSFVPTDINGAWTKIYPVGICIDQTDGNLLLWCQNGFFGATDASIVKIDSSTGAIIWNTDVPPNSAGAYVAQFANSSIAHQSLGIITTPGITTVTTIDTSDGSSSSYTSGLAGVGEEGFQCYNDTLGCIVLSLSFLAEAGGPTLLNSTPSAFNGWAALYVNPGFTPPPPAPGKGKVYSRMAKKKKPTPITHKSAVGSSQGKGGAAAFARHGVWAVGTAAGVGAATALAGRTATAVGSAIGAGVAAAIAGGGVTAVGTSAGAGTASAISGGVITAVGTAAGQGAAAGVSSIPGLLTTMTLVNTSGSTQAANFITPIFGMTFKKGDIITGTAPIFSVSGTPQPYSWGLQSYYSDGSLRHASFMFRCSSSITGNGTLTVNINSGGTAPSASSRTLTEVYAQNLQVGGPGLGLFGGLVGTWNGYLRNDANNTEQYVYMDGQAGKAWRIKTHMATSAGGAAHGQLEVYHYVTALQDNSGNLGGFRHIGRITQPYYNNDTPTKALRAFASVSTQYGVGPTSIPLTWPFNNINFTGTNGVNTYTVAAAGTHNLYSGAQAGSGGAFTNVVPGYLSATTDAALTTNQIYFAYTQGPATTDTSFYLSENTNTQPGGSSYQITSSGGTGTFVPIPVVMHFGSVWTADNQGRSNFFQGTGSMAADSTVRTQFNPAYLHSTGAIPPWNLSVTGTAFSGTIKDIPAIVGASSSGYWTGTPLWNAVSCGPLAQALRGSTGSAPDIGPLTLWHCAHFYNQSAVGDMAIRAIAYASDYDLVGSFRDISTGNYVNISNTSYTGMPAPSSNQQTGIEVVVGISSGFTAPSTPAVTPTTFLWGGEQDQSHKPSMAYYGFLVFGEPHFYDLMIEAATGIAFEQYAPARQQSSPAGYGIVMGLSSQGLRGNAWALRDLVTVASLAASTSPDGSQVPQYVNDLAVTNLQWSNALYSATYLGSALNSENRWSSADGTDIDATSGGFMMGYCENVMAWAAALGFSDALTWVNNYATWVNYVVSTYGDYHLYCEYDGPTILDISGNLIEPPITALSQWGIVCNGIFASLSWQNSSSPYFTANTPGFGYTVTAGDRYVFGADHATKPGGFSYQTPYYVRDVSGNNFNLAASPGGTAIVATDTGSLTPGTSGASGASSPFIALAAAPVPSTGLFPNSAAGQPNSYLLYRQMAWNWAVAAGATGYSTPLADATTRLNADLPDFTSNANWYGQDSL